MATPSIDALYDLLTPERYRAGPDWSLEDWPTDDGHRMPGGKPAAKEALKAINKRTEALQELLYADGRQKLLVVLQGMDASGKDGVIRHVFNGVNPQGVDVAKFGVPSEEELAHDFLWRVHPHAPGNGQITIFNRSHYEDVLVVRVRGLAPEAVWRSRYGHIRAFEDLLADAGTTILKFFVHISKGEQKERLQARLDEPHKRWKFNPGDLEERPLWPDYMAAYEEAVRETTTDRAPWYVVPADRKWYRNLIVGLVIVRTLEGLDMVFPQPDLPAPPDEIVIE